jgi:hypothetical protein
MMLCPRRLITLGYGVQPHAPETSPLQLMKKVVKGARPPIPPPSFPLADELQRLMQDCWHRTPESRPSFDQVCSELGTTSCALLCALLCAFTGISAGALRTPQIVEILQDLAAYIERYDGANNVPFGGHSGQDTLGSLPTFRQHSVLSGIGEEGESVLSGSAGY